MFQEKTPLLDAISTFIATDPAYFRIPGHRLDKGISSRWTEKVGTDIFSYDVTETPLTDDLHSPDGAIAEAQELLRQLYGADKSYFLINGSTCGNEAMILGAALDGEKIMIARNAHKSAMMGLILSGASPVYVMPELIPEWSIQGEITACEVQKCFAKNPDCKALFLVSPSYYGICSDLKEIADVCHRHGALLLVDEAHGGHLYFHSQLPQGALACGADVCVQSMHKVAGALTQSSVLHIKSHGIREDALERIVENLHLVQSTSPNYLLMTSLDCARYELALNGEKMMKKALSLAESARRKIQGIYGFRCMNDICKKMTSMSEIYHLDMTRLVISASELGLSGFLLDKILFQNYGVNMELSDYENVLAVVTYANEEEDMDRLIKACEDISKTCREDSYKRSPPAKVHIPAFPKLPPQILTPRKAYFSRKKEVPWQDGAGKISGQMIAPYPPGIPVIYPGEQISPEVWAYIERFRKDGRHMHGTDRNGTLNTIKIIE
ncbi:MAG: aminotransferase class I/II-fold pyridoxal phosphate-dependent enzyme [Lachnospiraceae bacterium]|nr:aminotransferase class I/II-fold pyridoxal phosphate-dependent enzyme [Lachnospiraceae bacterium]